MKVRFFILAIQCFFVQNFAFGQVRYIDDLDGRIITNYQTYITYPLSACWKNGNKPKVGELMRNDNPELYNPSDIQILRPGSSLNNKCFNYFEMYSMKETYNINDTTVDLSIKIYELENDLETNRKAVIYISGAQGFFDLPTLGGGLRYWDEVYNNPNDLIQIKKQDEEICRYLAQKGYLVVAMDMRKGWDIKGITNMNATQELLAYWFHNYCDCEGSCDSYSILESNYRNLQDLLAVYGYLLNNKSTLKINTNGISFMGNSSGSYFGLLAGFGIDDYPLLEVPKSNNSPSKISLFEKFGSPFRYFNNDSTLYKVEKIMGLSSAISDTNWIELSDSVYFVNNKKFPVYIMQATNDNVYVNCGGQMRNAKYNNILDEKLYFFGGGTVHDRIMNLGGTQSHLITQMAMKHGGLFGFHQFHCYNPNFSNVCFESQSIFKEMKDKVATMLYYPVKKPDDYIHVVLGAHKQDDLIAADKCNLCDLTLISKPDSLGDYYLSSCNYNIGALFSDDYYTNIVTDVENPFVKSNNQLKIYPNLSATFVNIELNGEWINENAYIILYDLLGKPISKYDINNWEKNIRLNITNITKGIYLVALFDERNQSIAQGKIIKI